jgi:cytoskeletal protein RodZ
MKKSIYLLLIGAGFILGAYFLNRYETKQEIEETEEETDEEETDEEEKEEPTKLIEIKPENEEDNSQPGAAN